MGCDATSGRPRQITRDDEISVRAACASRRLLRDLARAERAYFTADTGKAKGAVWLLLVETVKTVFAANAVHIRDHFAHRRVRRLGHDIGLAGEGLAIFRNRRHVVREIVVVMVVMTMAMITMTVMMPV